MIHCCFPSPTLPLSPINSSSRSIIRTTGSISPAQPSTATGRVRSKWSHFFFCEFFRHFRVLRSNTHCFLFPHSLPAKVWVQTQRISYPASLARSMSCSSRNSSVMKSKSSKQIPKNFMFTATFLPIRGARLVATTAYQCFVCTWIVTVSSQPENEKHAPCSPIPDLQVEQYSWRVFLNESSPGVKPEHHPNFTVKEYYLVRESGIRTRVHIISKDVARDGLVFLLQVFLRCDYASL